MDFDLAFIFEQKPKCVTMGQNSLGTSPFGSYPDLLIMALFCISYSFFLLFFELINLPGANSDWGCDFGKDFRQSFCSLTIEM